MMSWSLVSNWAIVWEDVKDRWTLATRESI
jgi:hypothetical protein